MHANAEVEVPGRHYPLELEVLLGVVVERCLREVVYPQQRQPGDGDALSAVVVVVVHRHHQGWLEERVLGLLPQLQKHLLLEVEKHLLLEVEKHLLLQEEVGLLLQLLALSSS